MVVGASMGAVAALAYAVTASDIAGVVAVSSPSEWRLPLRVRSITTACLARTRVGRSFAHRRMHVRIAPWTSSILRHGDILFFQKRYCRLPPICICFHRRQ